MHYTTNYQLPQWEAADRILMRDFNDMTAKIEAGLTGVNSAIPKIVAGSYTGNGESDRTISLGGQPKAVYVCNSQGQTISSTNYYGGLAVPGHPVKTLNAQLTVLEICSTGFIVHRLYSDPYMTYANSNQSDMVYHSVAVL